MDVEVTDDPIGIDVQLDGSLHLGGDEAVSESADGEILTGSPDELTVGTDAEGVARHR